MIYHGSRDAPAVPLMVFVDEIDAVPTENAMKGIITALKGLYERRLILPLVAGNMSNLFAAGIHLSRGSHHPFWLQPFSSTSDLELLLHSRLNIQPLRSDNLPDTQNHLSSSNVCIIYH